MTQHDDELEKAAIRYAPQNVHIDLCLRKAFKAGYRAHAEKTKELVAENAVLRNALEFYANNPYEIQSGYSAGLVNGPKKHFENEPIICSQKAKEALATSNGDVLKSVREAMVTLALMADGEGSNEAVYMQMSKNAHAKLKKYFGET